MNNDIALNLSTISSIATLILFVFYFIGRLFTGMKNLKFKKENFELVPNDDDFDEHENALDLGGHEWFKMSSQEPMNWIKFFKVDYDDAKDSFIKNPSKYIKMFRYISTNDSVHIKTDVPEGIPNLLIEFERFDYIRGDFLVGYDGRTSGIGMCPHRYKMALHFKTILYYLMR
jgi:hypothetical protein